LAHFEKVCKIQVSLYSYPDEIKNHAFYRAYPEKVSIAVDAVDNSYIEKFLRILPNAQVTQ
jgi:hypothetical protein